MSCTLCGGGVVDKKEIDKPADLDKELKVIFTLRKLLQLSRAKCEGYLVNYGHPSNWISTCSKCSLVVMEAHFLSNQIQLLERKLDKLRARVISNIKKCSYSNPSSSDKQRVGQDLKDWVADNHVIPSPPNPTPTYPSCGVSFHDEVIDNFVPIKEERQDVYEPEGGDDFLLIPDSDDKTENEGGDDLSADTTTVRRSRRVKVAKQSKSVMDDGDENQEWIPNSDDDDEFEPDDSSTKNPESGLENGKLSCKYCKKVYLKPKHLENHHKICATKSRKTFNKVGDYQFTTEDGKLGCKVCNKVFTQRGILRRHQNFAHSLYFKTCPNQYRPSQESVPVQVANNQLEFEDGKFGCKLCEKIFDKRATLRKHQNSAHSLLYKPRRRKHVVTEKADKVTPSENNAENQRDCRICNVTFPTDSTLLNHQVAFHSNNDVENRKQQRIDYLQLVRDVELVPWKCSGCAKYFPSQEKRDQHEEEMKHIDASNENNARTQDCSICAKSFPLRSELIFHLELEHEGDSLESLTSSNLFRCEICPAKFYKMPAFEFHMGKVHNIANNPEKKNVIGICPICGLACISLHYFDVHIQKHMGKSLLCEICSQSFTEIRYLNVHKIKSHGESSPARNPLGCGKCNKIFSNIYALRLHVKTVHEKTFKYICAVCGAGRQHMGALKYHMLSHGDGQEHKCKVSGCSAIFKSVNTLRHHISSQHGNKKKARFSCGVCGNDYYDRSTLNRHKQAVHKQTSKLFRCEICDKSFPIKEYYTSHMKSHKK